MRLWPTTVVPLIALTVLVWASDKVTLQGERTVYTVECVGGTWDSANRCNGHLIAGDRYKFRARKTRREVIFWTAGSAEPAGKFTDCDITDGRNWICRPTADAQHTIALQISKGDPVPDSKGRTKPFHAIAKWRWLLLRWGILSWVEPWPRLRTQSR